MIIAGFAGDICILFTAIDAHMRNFDLFLPHDCIVSQNMEENDRLLKYMERVLDADIRAADQIDLPLQAKTVRRG